MVNENERYCPNCGGELKHYDTVRRRVLGKFRIEKRIYMERVRCKNCNSYHVVVTDMIFPYKHYEADIIKGVIENFINQDTLGYENYPCEMTMLRWKSQNLQRWCSPSICAKWYRIDM